MTDKSCKTCEWYNLDECCACERCNNDLSEYQEANWIKEHDEKVKVETIEDCVSYLKEQHYTFGKTTYIQAIEDLEQLKEGRKMSDLNEMQIFQKGYDKGITKCIQTLMTEFKNPYSTNDYYIYGVKICIEKLEKMANGGETK